MACCRGCGFMVTTYNLIGQRSRTSRNTFAQTKTPRTLFATVLPLMMIVMRSTAAANGNNTIHVVVSVPFDPPYIFRKEIIKPAVDFALDSVRLHMPKPLQNYDFLVSFRNSTCSRKAALEVVEYYHDSCNRKNEQSLCLMTSPLVFLGPVCSDASSVVALFAEKWNVPIISTGAHAMWVTPGPEYPLLTRITPSYADLGYFIHNLFKKFQYASTHLVDIVYEDVFYGQSEEDECYYMMQAIRFIFVNEDYMIDVEGHAITDANFNSDEFVKNMDNPKCVLMCASSDSVRKIMLSARAQGYTVKGRNDWFVIDLHNDDHYAHGAWKRGDSLDYDAKSAYRALWVFTLKTSKTDQFINFTKAVQAQYRMTGTTANVNAYVEGFYDSILLYVRALNDTIRQGFSPLNGKVISENMRNITFPGIAGPVSLDAYGDRKGDYSVLTMGNQGKFETYMEYFGHPPRLMVHPKTPKSDSDNPKDLPGWTKISGQGKHGIRNNAITIGLSAIAAIIICCFLIAGRICYRNKCSSRSNNHNTYNQHEAIHIPLREEVSVTTCMTGLEEDMKA
ncbi:unnamed protein product [Clavelina lepadiformis]|uniref:Receptor ligand binding region domain-containing protein n=1 Tax=Clavelina lepadiformis TaxID=159417 RepID=A0ABP0F276_CLALP